MQCVSMVTSCKSTQGTNQKESAMKQRENKNNGHKGNDNGNNHEGQRHSQPGTNYTTKNHHNIELQSLKLLYVLFKCIQKYKLSDIKS